MFVLIDNYDSFTYNLYHFLGELGASLKVIRNDAITVEKVMALHPQGIILSPGPCDPDKAGICLPLIKAAATQSLPMFGVCLGMQAIGQAFGGQIRRAPTPMHGKVSEIHHNGSGIFSGIPSPLRATRYHSLIVAENDLPTTLEITARCENLIMGLAHKSLPIFGVQFHPESIASEHGHRILANFLRISGHNNTRQDIPLLRA